MNLYTKWADRYGYIITANEDGSIPLNSKVIIKTDDEEGAARIVEIHNKMLYFYPEAAK